MSQVSPLNQFIAIHFKNKEDADLKLTPIERIAQLLAERIADTNAHIDCFEFEITRYSVKKEVLMLKVNNRLAAFRLPAYSKQFESLEEILRQLANYFNSKLSDFYEAKLSSNFQKLTIKFK